jgi:hypothetical protein
VTAPQRLEVMVLDACLVHPRHPTGRLASCAVGGWGAIGRWWGEREGRGEGQGKCGRFRACAHGPCVARGPVGCRPVAVLTRRVLASAKGGRSWGMWGGEVEPFEAEREIGLGLLTDPCLARADDATSTPSAAWGDARAFHRQRGHRSSCSVCSHHIVTTRPRPVSASAPVIRIRGPWRLFPPRRPRRCPREHVWKESWQRRSDFMDVATE